MKQQPRYAPPRDYAPPPRGDNERPEHTRQPMQAAWIIGALIVGFWLGLIL